MSVTIRNHLPVTDYIAGLGNVTILRRAGNTELLIEDDPADDGVFSVRQCLERYVAARRETLKLQTEEIEIFESIIKRIRRQGG